MSNQKQIQMAAKLYEIRDAAKSILGANFNTRMAEIGKILKDKAAIDKSDVLQAAIKPCKDHQFEGMNVIIITAAAVELTEPSEA